MSWSSRPRAWGLAALVALAAASGEAGAQGFRETQVWGVVVASRPEFAGVGLGMATRDARRTRLAAAFAVGATDDGDLAGRAEVAAHFLLDPLRSRGRAWYGGGGLALATRPGDGARAYVQAVLGMESAPARPRGWFVEAGVGGGIRVAAGLRWRKANAPGR